MRHVKAEDLIGLAEDKIPGQERATAEDHLRGCLECQDLRHEIEGLLTQLRADARFEPPAELVQWGVELFKPMQRLEAVGESVPKKLRRIIATLVFDTYDEPLPVGVRRASLPPRQMLYRSGDIDVDVKIQSLETDGRISLAGQVLS
ncbi:MAG TPA: hypothetical protein VFY29_03575, partial [Terriglobia bacterium]|nr:hypothetical protein [Terriglobia bacterium]